VSGRWQSIICADLAGVRCCDEDGQVLDDDAVSCPDLLDWSAEFESLEIRVASVFPHPKTREHAGQYLEGLLAPIERKNGWVRHEAPCDRVEVGDLHRRVVAAAWLKLRAA
jgi:hypothetical protein